MNSNFDISTIEQYKEIFGQEKMSSLLQEFISSAKEGFEKAQTASLDDLRIIFHSLRSSSLVFGMKGFSEQCALIEEKIIQGEDVLELEKEIKKVKMLFRQELEDAKKYLM